MGLQTVRRIITVVLGLLVGAWLERQACPARATNPGIVSNRPVQMFVLLRGRQECLQLLQFRLGIGRADDPLVSAGSLFACLRIEHIQRKA